MKTFKRTKPTPRFLGVCDAAAKVGVSKSHLSQVLHGTRECSRALRAKLKKIGYAVP